MPTRSATTIGAVVARSGSQAWVIGRRSYFTRDAGRYWLPSPALDGAGPVVVSGSLVVAVIRDCNGTPVCRGALVISRDAGAHWQRLPQPASLSGGDSVAVRGARVVVQLHDRLLVSTSSGRRFEVRQPGCSGSEAWPGNPVALDPNAVLWELCGLEPSAGNQLKELYRSGDLGRHWTLTNRSDTGAPGATSLSPGYLAALLAPAPQTLLVTALRATPCQSTNGGRTWRTAIPVDSDPDAGWLTFADSKHGWIQILQATVYTTNDGGRHWTHIPTKRLLAG